MRTATRHIQTRLLQRSRRETEETTLKITMTCFMIACVAMAALLTFVVWCGG